MLKSLRWSQFEKRGACDWGNRMVPKNAIKKPSLGGYVFCVYLIFGDLLIPSHVNRASSEDDNLIDGKVNKFGH